MKLTGADSEIIYRMMISKEEKCCMFSIFETIRSRKAAAQPKAIYSAVP